MVGSDLHLIVTTLKCMFAIKACAFFQVLVQQALPFAKTHITHRSGVLRLRHCLQPVPEMSLLLLEPKNICMQRKLSGVG